MIHKTMLLKTMIQKEITFFGHRLILACDANCDKAWGINHRPKVHLSSDVDDYAFLTDGELGTAPQYPGTWEGECGKPLVTDERPNKWCARECERSVLVKIGEDIVLPDFSERRYNQPFKHEKESVYQNRETTQERDVWLDAIARDDRRERKQ